MLARSLAPLVKTRGFGMAPGQVVIFRKLHHYARPEGELL
jgi:hypothetical protein